MSQREIEGGAMKKEAYDRPKHPWYAKADGYTYKVDSFVDDNACWCNTDLIAKDSIDAFVDEFDCGTVDDLMRGDDQPWLIAPGAGFDAHIIVVFADNMQTALDTFVDSDFGHLVEIEDDLDELDEEEYNRRVDFGEIDFAGNAGTPINTDDIRIFKPCTLFTNDKEFFEGSFFDEEGHEIKESSRKTAGGDYYDAVVVRNASSVIRNAAHALMDLYSDSGYKEEEWKTEDELWDDVNRSAKELIPLSEKHIGGSVASKKVAKIHKGRLIVEAEEHTDQLADALQGLVDYIASGDHYEVTNPYAVPQFKKAMEALHSAGRVPKDDVWWVKD